jgi:twitching motility two-component system response regulator PilG
VISGDDRLIAQFVNQFIDVKFAGQRTIEASSRHCIANLSANRVLGASCKTGADRKTAARRENRTFSGSGKSRMQSIVDPTETEEIDKRDEDTGEDKATAVDGDFSGLKVMVIDDSKTIRRTAETLLKKAGCEVVTATDGFEALAKIADEKPAIIFVDIMMPRLDGYQTCALIKNNQIFKETPVIMLSSKDGLFDRARGRIVGSDQYLTKPFTKEELLGAIREHVHA